MFIVMVRRHPLWRIDIACGKTWHYDIDDGQPQAKFPSASQV